MAAVIAAAIILYGGYYMYKESQGSTASAGTMEQAMVPVTHEFAEDSNEFGSPDPTLIQSNPSRFPVLSSAPGQWGIMHNVHADTGGYVFDTWGDPNNLSMNSI